ncbi:MAG: hypothetical protein ABI947_00425 [Chloroflexota bacterium]
MQKRSAVLTTQQLMAAILFILLFAMAVRIPADTDTWWHLRSADYILAQHSVPLTDPFSLTKLNQPWIDQSWGSQLILDAFYRLLGGNIGLALYTAVLATTGLYVVYLMCDGNVFLRAFMIILAAATAAVFWSARPQMMSFLLSAVILYLLHLYKRRHLDRLWLIPILMVLWVNLHAGFFIGFLLLGGTIAGEVLGRLFDKANPDVLTWRQIGKLTLITMIAFLALVINPNTTQMWTYSFRTVGIGALQTFIQEWASPNFHMHETWPFLVLLFSAFAAAGLGSKHMDWTDLVLLCGMAFLAFYAQRNFSTFAIAATPILSRYLDALLKEHGIYMAKSRPPRGIGIIVNYVLLLLVIVGAATKIAITLNPKAVAAAQADTLPVNAAAYLNNAKPAGPMFNSYNWGGYLMYAAPQYPVFVDGRTDLYDDDLLNEWLHTAQGHNWQQTFDKWQIRLAVIEQDSPLAEVLRSQPTWKEVYHDKMASIFQQATP